MFTSTKSQIRSAAQAGFSLVELMVVVTIIGILAGIAVPKFQTFKARAIQTGAKSGLNGVYLAQQGFQANYGDYYATAASANNLQDGMTNVVGPAGKDIGFALGGAKGKYSYSMSSNATSFAAMAISTTSARINGKYDHMRVNTNNWLCSPFDAVIEVAATQVTTKAAGVSAKECPQAVPGGTGPVQPQLFANGSTLADDPL